MGCQSSKELFHAKRIDDSVHVMLKHSAKSSGPHCYVPRAPHPLLSTGCHSTICSEDDCQDVVNALQGSDSVASEPAVRDEQDLLLRLSKNHCDDVDPRDELEYAEREPVPMVIGQA